MKRDEFFSFFLSHRKFYLASWYLGPHPILLLLRWGLELIVRREMDILLPKIAPIITDVEGDP